MGNILEIVKTFQGVIGTLLGVSMTLLLTHFLKARGKFKFFILSSNIGFETDTHSLYGDRAKTDNKNEAEYLDVNIKLEVFNSSEIPKILRNFKLHFYQDDKCLLTTIPDDKGTSRSNGHWTVRDEFLNLNIRNILLL